jgi:hypothetical protein
MLGNAAVQIPGIPTQPFERESECEDTIERIDCHLLLQVLMVQCRYLCRVPVERHID